MTKNVHFSFCHVSGELKNVFTSEGKETEGRQKFMNVMDSQKKKILKFDLNIKTP